MNLTAEQLAPVFGADEHPGVRQLLEQRELMRRAGLLALRNGHLRGADLEDAKRRAALPPLDGPLGTGEPQA